MVIINSNIDVLGVSSKQVLCSPQLHCSAQLTPTPTRLQASQEEIKKAYLKAVKLYHPDLARTGVERVDREEKFKEITRAYDSLKQGILYEEAG